MSVVILRGDARNLPLPDASVDLIVTSPPYFGLRSYTDGGEVYEGQIGGEYTPWDYLDALLGCTREWVRVLKPTGSMFINLGDKYSTYTGANWGNGRSLDGFRGQVKVPQGGPVNAPEVYGIPYKSLMGLPWRYALRCIDDLGLILRAEIVWSKPNGMPESITDRVRRSHEHVFHLVKEARGYFASVDEVRQPHEMRPQRRPGGRPVDTTPRPGSLRQAWPTAQRTEPGVDGHPLGKLPGSVWEITSAPLTAPAHLGIDHFAAYPPELVRRIILGWSPSGLCIECGEGRRPVSARNFTPQADVSPERNRDHGLLDPSNGWGSVPRGVTTRSIEGYACACTTAIGPNLIASPPTRPALVLDPFGGTGTTALVADVLGRIGITVDRSADYCRLAQWRTSDPGERARALGVPKPPPVPHGQMDLFGGAA